MLSKKIIWKLNIIDLILIAIILLSIAALIYKTAWGKKDGEYREYTVTYVCETTPSEILDKINENDVCVDSGTGEEIGVFKSVESEVIADPTPVPLPTPTSTARSDEDEENEDEATPSPEPSPTPEPKNENTYSRAVFVTSAKGAQTEHGIRIENNVYLIGQSVELVIGNAIFNVYISDIY